MADIKHFPWRAQGFQSFVAVRMDEETKAKTIRIARPIDDGIESLEVELTPLEAATLWVELSGYYGNGQQLVTEEVQQ